MDRQALRFLSSLLASAFAWLSPRRARFDLSSVHVRFVVEKSGTGTGFPPSTSVFALSVSFHQRSLLGFTYMLLLTRRTKRRILGTFKKKKQCFFVNREAVDRQALRFLSSLLTSAVAWLSPRRARFDPSCQHYSTNAPYSFMYYRRHTHSYQVT